MGRPPSRISSAQHKKDMMCENCKVELRRNSKENCIAICPICDNPYFVASLRTQRELHRAKSDNHKCHGNVAVFLGEKSNGRKKVSI